MKQKARKNSLYILFLGLLGVCLIFFSGCNSDLKTECEKHIADIRNNYFEGKTDSFNVSFTSGKRESPYVLDGIANPLLDFGILTIYPNQASQDKAYLFCIEINGESLEGEFEKSPFDSSYAKDIERQCSDDCEIFVYIKDGTKVEIAKLECVSKAFALNSNKALQIAIDDGGQTLLNFLTDQNYEIYIKIIADGNKMFEEKFWYVMFLREDGEEYTIILDPNSSNVLAKNGNTF